MKNDLQSLVDWDKAYDSCRLCPRSCKINRHCAGQIFSFPTAPPGAAGTGLCGCTDIPRAAGTGFCGCTDIPRAARAALHHWEEPCISGVRGSGTVFFSGCTLRCCFCQNHEISSQGFGKDLTVPQLGEIFLNLQAQGAHNINLVTATQYLPSVVRALDAVKHRLTIPVVYNSGGYENVEIVRALKDYIDIWLPDLKYYSKDLSSRYSKAPDYFEKASDAVRQMVSQTGPLQFEGQLMTKGTIIRHMVLPGAKEDSIRLLRWMKDTLSDGWFLVSLMSQYTPFYRSRDYPEINRRITSYEYNKVVDTAIELGLVNGYMQEKSSAKEEYTPPFDLEGIPDR